MFLSGVILVTSLLAAASPMHHRGGEGHKGKHSMMNPMQMMKKMRMEMYVASGPDDDCGNPPDDTWEGNPMMDGCNEAEGHSVVCLCGKVSAEHMHMMEMKGMSAMPNPNTGFLLKCGKCKDPCALRWYPEDMMDMMEEHEEEAKEGDMNIPPMVRSLMMVAMEAMGRENGMTMMDREEKKK